MQVKNLFSETINFIRNSKGYTKLAIKNSFYEFSTTLVMKIGSVIFMIIMARLLLPELFGLYSLAFSTIMLFYFFSNIGINQTLVYFRSNYLDKKPNKAILYTKYLVKIKFFLIILSSIILLLIAKPLAENYYQKPIFLALLAGVLYIFFGSLISLLTSIFYSENKFKASFLKELSYQTLRLMIVPLIVIFSLSKLYSQSITLFLIIISLSFVNLMVLFLMIKISRNKLRSLNFLNLKLPRKEKIKILNFMTGVSFLSISSMLFGYIDILIIGRFLSAEFVGYYTAAFSLVSSSAILIVFSSSLFPIFSRMKGKKLEKMFIKSVKLTFYLSLLLFFTILFLSPIIIRLIFGSSYLPAIPILMMLSLLAINFPMADLYSNYLITQKKSKKIIKTLIITIVINIFLTYFLVSWLVNFSQIYAVFGATIATIFSRYIYLFGLISVKRKTKNLKN